MTIKMPLKKNSLTISGHEKIDQFIDKGGDPIKNEEVLKDITFTINIPWKLCKVIDEMRATTKMSRRAWLLQAAQEKIQKENLINTNMVSI